MTPFLYKYSELEIKQLLKTITIVCDTREQENAHVTGFFQQKNVPFIKQALNFGDYSYYLPAAPELGIPRDIWFCNDIVIERKQTLEELSGNFAQNRERFENEFLRAQKCDITLMIERGSLSDILNHKYQTDLKETAYFASLMAFEQRYRVRTAFVHMIHSGQFIYSKMYYHARELLKRG